MNLLTNKASFAEGGKPRSNAERAAVEANQAAAARMAHAAVRVTVEIRGAPPRKAARIVGAWTGIPLSRSERATLAGGDSIRIRDVPLDDAEGLKSGLETIGGRAEILTDS